MAAGFTEFRSKTEFSDLPIAGKRFKSMVFPPTDRWSPMAPPLLKQDRNRISGGMNWMNQKAANQTRACNRQRNWNNEVSNTRVSEVFGLLTID
jgi:hypothetical protein